MSCPRLSDIVQIEFEFHQSHMVARPASQSSVQALMLPRRHEWDGGNQVLWPYRVKRPSFKLPEGEPTELIRATRGSQADRVAAQGDSLCS